MPRHRHDMPFGAALLDGGGVRFRLYAPRNGDIDVVHSNGTGEKHVRMDARADGWYEIVVPEAHAGTLYRFAVGELLVPDPAARFSPDGVHAASEVIDPLAFDWPAGDWKGLPWNEHVFYELHVGTFTPEGTYAGVASKLDYLRDLGVTAIELLPLAECPGARNWGYDGVLPFSPSHNYGTPDDLKALVAAAHERGLAIYLDVVYNHFGPEANYLHAYANVFYTERFKTPWGAAIDVVDDDRSDVRRYFIENAIYWLQEYRFDGLRLDAVHQIYDRPERRFLRELAARVGAETDRTTYLVVENELNEAALLEAGFRAQWTDDTHHAAHVTVTGQTDGYYADYAQGAVGLLARTLTQGFGYQGEPSGVKDGEPRGEPSAHLELGSFVTFLQNHDQIGNRPFGDRITAKSSAEAVRAAVAVLLLAPTTPMLFMGEEWAAGTPFLFFCDFEPELAALVTEGRRNEFGGFAEFSDPAARERIPDPSSPDTFAASVLQWDELERAPHVTWHAYYRYLLHLRRTEIAPLIRDLRGTSAGFTLYGEYGANMHWKLASGTTLRLETNLGPLPASGFPAQPDGRIIYASHAAPYDAAGAPAWSVRWSLA